MIISGKIFFHLVIKSIILKLNNNIKTINHSPIEDPGLLQHVSQVDVRVQEVRIERDGLLKVVDRQPDLALGVEHAAQVAPGHGKVRPGFDGLQVACLVCLCVIVSWIFECIWCAFLAQIFWFVWGSTGKWNFVTICQRGIWGRKKEQEKKK